MLSTLKIAGYGLTFAVWTFLTALPSSPEPLLYPFLGSVVAGTLLAVFMFRAASKR